jgi:hypothetical protein
MLFFLSIFLHLKLLPFVLKLQISGKEEENLSARHGIDIKNCCVFYKGLEKWFILQIFYKGLEQSSKLTIDAAA